MGKKGLRGEEASEKHARGWGKECYEAGRSWGGAKGLQGLAGWREALADMHLEAGRLGGPQDCPRRKC